MQRHLALFEPIHCSVALQACLSRMGRLVRSSHEAADGSASKDQTPSRFTSHPTPDGGSMNVSVAVGPCLQLHSLIGCLS